MTERTRDGNRWVYPPLEERFWAKVQKTPTCWLWTGYCNHDGYGQLRDGDRARSVHRIAYELMVGPIPDGMTVDHVKAKGCMHRNCVNPDHLEVVPRLENMRRSRRTHCRKGHEFTPENTRVRRDTGQRVCRACDRESKRRSA